MKLFTTLLITIGLMPGISNQLKAQDTKTKTKLSLEIDPATFVFNGYSFHLRVQPKNSDHLLLGAGVYAMDMPSFFVDMNKENKDKNWDVRLNHGAGLFGEYYLSEVNGKWFLGTQVSLQEYLIENSVIEGNSKYTNALVMAYGGYVFRPFEFPVYFKGWAGLGYSSKISGENNLGGQQYDVEPITMFATVHVGYTIN